MGGRRLLRFVALSFHLLFLLQLRRKRTHPLLQQIQVLELLPRWQLPQTGRTDPVLGQELVDELVHGGEDEAVAHPPAQLAVVEQQRLQRLVHVDGVEGEPDVEGRQRAQVLEVAAGLDDAVRAGLFGVLTAAFAVATRVGEVQVLEHDLALGRELEHLEREAQERGRLLACAVGTSDGGQLDRAVAERGGIQTEALLLPVV